MNIQRFEELCAAYVLGSLEGEDLRAFRDEVDKGDPEKLAVLQRYHITALHIPLMTEQETPSASVKDKLLDQIKAKKATSGYADPAAERLRKLQESEISSSSSQNTWMRLAALFLLAICLVLAYYSFSLKDEKDSLQEVVEQQRLEILDLQNDLTEVVRYLDVVSARRAQFVSMDGLDPSPEGFGRIFLDVETNTALLQISELPLPPEDKDYQLWVIRDEVPISAGVFSFEEIRTNQYFRIDEFVEGDLDRVAAVAITLEPKGGMPQPTGDMFLLGQPGG